MGWSENDYGNIVTAFQAAYALGFLLMGWLVDRFGPKIGYGIAITVWTIGHVMHGFASSVASFMAARIVLGVGEAGHFPSVVRASSEWFPQKERSYAIGWVNSATTIGVILTAPTVALFMRVPWPAARMTTVPTRVMEGRGEVDETTGETVTIRPDGADVDVTGLGTRIDASGLEVIRYTGKDDGAGTPAAKPATAPPPARSKSAR